MVVGGARGRTHRCGDRIVDNVNMDDISLRQKIFREVVNLQSCTCMTLLCEIIMVSTNSLIRHPCIYMYIVHDTSFLLRRMDTLK